MNTERKELEYFTKALALGEPQHEVLRSRHDCIVIRAISHNGQKLIVKLWKKSGIRGFLRRISKTGNLNREWKTLEHLNRLNNSSFTVPKAIAKFYFDSPVNGYTQAIVMQDLGEGIIGTKHITKLLEQGADEERIKFENSIIEMTALIIKAGVLDRDNHLVNILVSPTLGVVRLDFELSRISHFPRLHKKELAKMIAALMTSYIVAINAHGKGKGNAFAMKLANNIDLPVDIFKAAKIFVAQNLELQQQKSGLDLRWSPPW